MMVVSCVLPDVARGLMHPEVQISDACDAADADAAGAPPPQTVIYAAWHTLSGGACEATPTSFAYYFCGGGDNSTWWLTEDS